MKLQARASFYSLLFLFAFVSTVKAADESFAYRFMGSPLLVLVVLIAIDAIAFAYHKIRK
jgi:hypothetical protein